MTNPFAVEFGVNVLSGVVVIVDNYDPAHPTRTVTNAADDIIPFLVNAGILTPERRVIYCDSEGVWDEIVHEGGQFKRFAPIQTRSFDTAMLTVCTAGRA